MSTATAGVNFFRQIGGSVGTALIGSLFIGRLTVGLSHSLPASFAGKLGGHAAGITYKQLEQLPPSIAHDFVTAYAHALTPLYVYLAPLLAIAFVLAWFVKEKPLSSVLGRGTASERATDPSRTADDGQTGTPAAHELAGGRRPVLTGRVLHGAAVMSGARVTLSDRDGNNVAATTTAQDGSYLLTIPRAGAFLVDAVIAHGTHGRQPATEQITAAQDSLRRDLVLADP